MFTLHLKKKKRYLYKVQYITQAFFLLVVLVTLWIILVFYSPDSEDHFFTKGEINKNIRRKDKTTISISKKHTFPSIIHIWNTTPSTDFSQCLQMLCWGLDKPLSQITKYRPSPRKSPPPHPYHDSCGLLWTFCSDCWTYHSITVEKKSQWQHLTPRNPNLNPEYFEGYLQKLGTPISFLFCKGGNQFWQAPLEVECYNNILI